MENLKMMDTEKEAPIQCPLPEEENVPSIQREIDGSVYTVKIHFAPEATETMSQKVNRMLKRDVIEES